MTKPQSAAQVAVDIFIRDSVKAKSFDDVLELLENALASFPISGFGYWSFPRECIDFGTGLVDLTNAAHSKVFRGPIYLKAAEKLYFGRQMFEYDPTLIASSQATEPLSTFDILQAQKSGVVSTAFTSFLQKLGICRDLYLPIHTPKRIQMLWVFSLSGRNTQYQSEVPLLCRLADRFALAISDFVAFRVDGGTGNLLTTRESQCILLIARGYSNSEIAADLGISVHAVKFHLSNLLQKLKAANRSEAIARAARAGLLIN